ncbi:DUF4118 domain-containing protein [Dactylosporangium sp. CA-092794]|uniref:DUF4118 domain-containing protein n=1 Tax=Dactylosporangium sp. CA-092794 TaxID=3239929 RepID=UPI003D93EFA6
MRGSRLSALVRPTPPSWWRGLLLALLLLIVETLLTAPLHAFTRETTPGVIYLVGVVVVSIVWGLWLGMATALASVAVFVYFYVSPIGNLADSDVQDVTPLVVFVGVAFVVSALADQSRMRAAQAQESDLTADMARLLLDTRDVTAALPAVAGQIAHALDLRSAAIEPEPVVCGRHPPPDGTGGGEPAASYLARPGTLPVACPLYYDGTLLGTLRVPGDVSDRQADRLRERVVPPLASLLHAACERESMVNALWDKGEELQRRAAQQAALRRVATLVARAVSPDEVFHAVTTEVSQLLDNHHTTLLHYEPDDTVTVVSTNQPNLVTLAGRRWPIGTAGESGSRETRNVTELVRRTGRPARNDNCADSADPGDDFRRSLGIHAAVAVPIVIENRLWGTIAVTSTRPESLPLDAEARISDFTDLAGTAVANADNRAQLMASRARIATAADETRQRIERDLHDGAQQHLIAIGLELRTAEEADLPPEQLRAYMARAATSLTEVTTDLRELARGIHPAVLGTGGLAPALKALARRSAVPVDLHVDIDRRPPKPVEIAAYYVVSESLTNTAKHARASAVRVEATTHAGMLQITITDDGIGGADPARGSGLTGLRDRVETLGGNLTLMSDPGGGTSLVATIPDGSGPPPAYLPRVPAQR